MLILKIVILTDFETVSKFKPVEEADFQQCATLRTDVVFEWP
jgi:hypothetical protein